MGVDEEGRNQQKLGGDDYSTDGTEIESEREKQAARSCRLRKTHTS